MATTGTDSATAVDSNYQFIDIENYLGHANQQYKNELYKFALTSPSKYFDMRSTVLKIVKTEATKNLYKTFYNLMLHGTDLYNKPLITTSAGGEFLKPNIPMNKVNSFALSAVSTLSEICDELIDQLLPLEINKILSSKFADVGLGENPQN